jgi:hypothetical protein
LIRSADGIVRQTIEPYGGKVSVSWQIAPGDLDNSCKAIFDVSPSGKQKESDYTNNSVTIDNCETQK